MPLREYTEIEHDRLDEIVEHKQPSIIGHRDCDLCDNDHEDEITINWNDTGWDCCQTCVEQGVAEEALLDDIYTTDDFQVKWAIDLLRSYKAKADLSAKQEKYWMGLATERLEELAKVKS